ncbi:MAG: hypothetical protein MZW92_55835 [Comamonadaceae bacterium]|nr:hypothetical protein [Comamonadaceae bacterium]
MKLTLKTPKPRNPLVAPSLQRKAGSHRIQRRREPPAGPGRTAARGRTPATQPLDPTPGASPPHRPGHPMENHHVARSSLCRCPARGSPCARVRGRRAARRQPCARPPGAFAWPTSRSRERGPSPRLEFYAEAGAPEGALYVDGRLVGVVDRRDAAVSATARPTPGDAPASRG